VQRPGVHAATSQNFVTADVTIVRLSHLPESSRLPTPPDGRDQVDAMLDYLRQVAADPLLRETITVSSSSLAGTLEKIIKGEPVAPAKLRRATHATMRYLSRMTHRPTPFGLLAGVCPVRFEGHPKIRVGSAHIKIARADNGWLTAVVLPLQTDPVVLGHLSVVTNDLSRVRDGRLVLAHQTTTEERSARREKVRTVRFTPAVALAMQAAQTPVPYSELLETLLTRYPQIERAVIERSLAVLIERDFLRTDLLPPPTATDPLSHVLDKLTAVDGHPAQAALTEVARLLGDYSATPIGTGATAWRRATRAMRALHVTDNLIQVDLRIDAEFTLPDTVTDEIISAATVAWRLRPDWPGPVEQLAGYRRAFIDWYGWNTLIPLKELTDPATGLGLPAHYGGAAGSDNGTDDNVARDALFLALAQRAAALGQREVVLDDELITRLAQRDGGPDESAYAEVCAELLAEHEDSLLAGDFRLVLTGSYGNRTGAMFGRFLHVVPELTESVAQNAEAMHGGSGTAVPAQVHSVLRRARLVNVIQAPLLSPTAISVGGALSFLGSAEGEAISIADLGIAVDPSDDQFHVYCMRTGREVAPYAPHALSIQHEIPAEARLLVEIGMGRAVPWQLWHWGTAEMLPYLPRIRYGRTVLASARWKPDPELIGVDLDWTRWSARWERWRAEWNIPDLVQATVSDNRVLVDLTRESDLRMLRAELDRRPRTALYEQPLIERHGRGWAGGRQNEIVFSLRPLVDRTPHASTIPAAEPGEARSGREYHQAAGPVHHPGGEWLSLTVHSPINLHDQVLLSHALADLLRHAEGVSDRWFFLRYYEQDAGQLRLRFHGEAAALAGHLLPAARGWMDALNVAGLASHFSVDTYRPEIARYGGPQAIEAAERVFHADSKAALEQLALRGAGLAKLPLELLIAANHLDLLTRLDPDGWRTWLLDSYPNDRYHRTFQTHRRCALSLLDPAGGWAALRELPGGAQLLASWQGRAPRVAAYGELIRCLVAEGRLASTTTAFQSMLHMSHNRHAGMDLDAEKSTYAVVRGVVQARLDRERHAS